MGSGMRRLALRVLGASPLQQLAWASTRGTLRILTYHGICADAVAHETWLPQCFVSVSQFERQLAYLTRHARVLPLAEAAQALSRRSLPDRAVALTFDDGYSNNLHLALPVLERYSMPATVFVATSYVTSEELFPFDRFRLLDLASGRKHWLQRYKREPLGPVLHDAQEPWLALREHLTSAQYETLRPLSLPELKSLRSTLVDIGSHTHSHFILGRESSALRRDDIDTSIQLLTEWLGRRPASFSYPNGESGDFSEDDQGTLRKNGIQAAVSGIPGINRFGCDLLQLKRYPVGIFHDADAFAAEVTGWRTWAKSIAPRRPAWK